ncbi:MAG: DNA repair protein RadA [candidate division WOR-3 bacterium]|nr:DNA repair protein RadA [candidate division WOR-3 bacterium]
MTKKSKTVFVCQSCGAESIKWLGQCPACQGWGTLVEEIRTKTQEHKTTKTLKNQPVILSQITATEKLRYTTGIKELDQVLGGGIVTGSVILIGGEPGIGKTTLTLQIANAISQLSKTNKVLYITGEESIEQVKLHAERLGISNDKIYLLAENELESILSHIHSIRPILVVIDSIQTIYSSNLASAPGSVAQVRECTAEIMRVIKKEAIETNLKTSAIIIGHITKIGAIAGPKTLEHIVDVVLYFEGDKFQQYRILRATKNRFGSTQEIGVFEMTEQGLSGVESPSLLFLSLSRHKFDNSKKIAGSVVIPTIEGSRPILLEVQALTAPSYYSFPQRITTGLDLRRLAMLLCILERYCGINVGNHDVFINTSGGIKISEPGADLGVMVAIASTYKNKPIASNIAIVGEVSLSGEIRPVVQMKSRINECARMGFNQIIGPAYSFMKDVTDKISIETIGVNTVRDALEVLGII